MYPRLPAVLTSCLRPVKLFLLARLRRDTGPARVVAAVPPVTRRHRPAEVPPSPALAASIDRRDPDGPYRSLEDGETRPIVIGDREDRPLLFPDKYISGRNRGSF